MFSVAFRTLAFASNLSAELPPLDDGGMVILFLSDNVHRKIEERVNLWIISKCLRELGRDVLNYKRMSCWHRECFMEVCTEVFQRPDTQLEVG